MSDTQPSKAEQIARAASAYQKARTGHSPTSVTAVLNEDTLVITLHGVLTPAEQAVAKKPGGAEKVKEFHRQLFASSDESLRRDIKRITGVDVREATSEIEPGSGTVVHAFSSGTMVQVFLLTEPLSEASWNAKTIPRQL